MNNYSAKKGRSHFQRFFLITCLLSIALLPVALADIGVGLSPAKRIYNVEGGQVVDDTYTVYNTGDGDLLASISADGVIAQFVTIDASSLLVKPEPNPHTLPIKNGQTFHVRYKIPTGWSPQTYTGNIVASGGRAPGSTLGGSVSVAMQVEIYAKPTRYFWNRITPNQWMLIGGVLIFIVLFFGSRRYMKKRGIHLRFIRDRR